MLQSLHAMRQQTSRGLGLLPPPGEPRLAGVRPCIEWSKSGRPDFDWGRGGEGGSKRFGPRGYPPPCPSPARGEGTLWPEPSNLLTSALVSTLVSTLVTPAVRSSRSRSSGSDRKSTRLNSSHLGISY